ncbi:exoribonuclease II [Buchnera aphidicola]|uniref:Exoribonuclease II n=1 Tax=Buchnera aphidicola (Cinara cf. splendens/pseudotsugae 3390) TaxID=2518980 RepID=A0A451CXP7_9GAMM|nr:exoribonuclease II [Buchnera aphidicola]VFP77750.1 Exoribonuclease 2 [Buchnera aphidicola (Cinara cf. splendens/pseudotsugae 3390)]
MFQNNPVLIQLKNQLYKKKFQVKGIVKSTSKGFGFLRVDSKTTYFIPPQNMKKVINGDKIVGSIETINNREIVFPKKLIEPFLKKFIGFVHKHKNSIYIQSRYPYIQNVMFYKYSTTIKRSWKNGDWVSAKLQKHSLCDKNNCFSIKIIKFISEKKNPLSPWHVILSKYNLEKKSPEVDFLNFFPKNIPDNNRVDLTNLDFITIDNNHTQDIDDAVYIEETNSSHLILTVAIADPTEYISVNTEIDNIAKKRVFTNYLPGLNISMLPKEFSENLCSLQPFTKRPALACKILIDNDGTIITKKTKFFLAWIKSQGKLSYDNVSDWLEKSGTWKPSNKRIEKQIFLLNKVYIIRNKWRKKHAILFKNYPEYTFHLSKKWEILNISVDKKRIAHRMIEESMISANICAADFLDKELGFGLYHAHSGFNYFNIKNVVKFLKKYNILYTSEELMTISGFCRLKRSLDILSDEYVNYRICKFQSFGEICAFPKPHFSLGLSSYATWTSPIRKYSDMINHRLIKSVIKGCKNISPPDHSVISHIVKRKRKTRMAVRKIEEWLYTNFFHSMNYDKKNYYACIIDVSRRGMSARLLKNGAFIFIPITYIHNIHYEVICKPESGVIYIKNKLHYKISDNILVRLLSINHITKKIIATLVK